MARSGRTARGRPPFAAEDHGQFVAMAAVLLVIIVLVGGLSVDYGTTYLSHARFRNAMDAAALAGANERQRNPAGGEPAVRTVALQYLALHGYVPDNQTTITVTLVPPPLGSATETVRVEATRAERTYFLRLAGISSVAFGASTEAAIGAQNLDVVLSMDITGSMAPQMPEMRIAVRAFVDQLNPSTSNPNGPQLALAVFNGKNTPPPNFNVTPSSRVVQAATYLTRDYGLLTKIVDNTGGATCPAAWPSPQPPWADTSWSSANRICPLQADPGSGTYVGNGFEIAFQPQPGTNHWNLWDPTLGGRSGAKKVLVLITDGSNNVSGVSVADADTATVAAANAVKLGPDGVAGTSDDVEIYTIGFFDTSSDPSNFATSPPLCPAAVEPPGATSNDRELIDASSSKTGSCDHYFPLNKSQLDQLPTLFSTIAKQLLRSRLVK